MKQEKIDYRGLRWNNLGSERFRHLKLLIFWPVFELLFIFVERGWTNRSYAVMHCLLDDKIPFCEFFLIPYLFWFVYIIGMHLYTLLYEKDAFVKMMRFIILTYSVTILIYFLFPTKQELRPAVFARSNFLTACVSGFYAFDTNTNVCPSIHVIGSLAVLFTAWNSRRFHTPLWRFVFTAAAVLICASTVFLKQHSVLDILAALPICLAGYLLVFRVRAPVRLRRPEYCKKETGR
ncbi:MAG: phosphatase PAP2 family protein [Oscillibacter sp.]|jgi:multisubunit Na+/H+ antiporter MnhC subunit|nr:phosphatase PAP2 family protein [Oscillibacter sp.]